MRRGKAPRSACCGRPGRRPASFSRIMIIVTFVSDEWEGEYMHLYTATGWTGTLKECDEGVLEWVGWEKMKSLPQWEGDKIFLRLLEEKAPFFSLKLCYKGDRLTFAALNGKELAL